MRYWVRFGKLGLQRYISHRDMHRMVGRIALRAGLPIAYSQGFNPYLRISFSNPLELGIESRGEYLDLILTDYMPAEEILTRLRENAPAGMDFAAIREIPLRSPKLPAFLTGAGYRTDYAVQLAGILCQMWSKDHIAMEKKTKKGLAVINVRSLMHDLLITEGQHINIVLSSGQEGNLKISELSALIASQAHSQNIEEHIWIKTESYGLRDGLWLNPYQILEKEGDFWQEK